MSRFKPLDKKNNYYRINNPSSFNPISNISENVIQKVYNFAYQMTFGNIGEHRHHRTGGTHYRKNGEIFANTFQGKLAEFAFYETLKKANINISKPDLSVYSLGKWDSQDFTINNKEISIKSTKSYGNLILLETMDLNNEGEYLPNKKAYDYTFLIRMNPFCEDLMKRNRLLYSNEIDENHLYNIIKSNSWTFDIPGYITKEDLLEIIKSKHIIPKGAILNRGTKMDASNYYVQSGDLRKLSEFIKDFGDNYETNKR